ncbi:MAG: hypothetical protein ABH950_09800 [Candidatus Altiarchaeota archaeon]
MRVKITAWICLSLMLLSSFALGFEVPDPSAENVKKETFTAYVFWGEGCPHCNAEKRFLAEIEDKYPGLEIQYLEIYNNDSNRELFNNLMQKRGVQIKGVPTFVLGNTEIVGYQTDQTSGKQIEEAIEYCLAFGCGDSLEDMNEGGMKMCIHIFIRQSCPHCRKILPFVEELRKKYGFDLIIYDVEKEGNRKVYEDVKNYYLIQGSGFPILFLGNKYLLGDAAIKENLEAEILSSSQITCAYPFEKQRGLTSYIPQPGDLTLEDDWIVDLPLFGELNTASMNLSLFTLMIGLIDGFNPCAMWVLMFMLTIISYAKSRKRILLIGGIFVATSGVIYFAFMTAWLNIFLYIGYVNWMRILIGIVAVIAGLINIKDFFWFRRGVSLTLSDEKKDKILARIRKLARQEEIPALIIGTVILAVFVNLFELACTFGFPAIYTRILTLKGLPTSLYYMYLALYCVFYVVPLAAIVTVFAYTLGHQKLSPEFGRILKLLGGLLMVGLGAVLIYYPELLSLG